MQNKFLILLITSIAIIGFQSCSGNNQAEQKKQVKAYTSPCGCVISDKEMISLCPVDALGDSILICKLGTNNVIGSNRPPMTWTEFIQSEYTGGEGTLTNCKTGESLFPGLYAPVLSYKNKKLLVDERVKFDVFQPSKNAWVEIEIPVWRNVVYAVNSEISISPDTLIFKPPFQEAKAFKAVAKEYEEEEKRTDHYMISRIANRLLTCSLNGDKLSEQRLLNLEKTFSEYYAAHEDSKKILEEKINLLKAYNDFLANGGKRKFYDISNFVYF